jgi:hypothetical protein
MALSILAPAERLQNRTDEPGINERAGPFATRYTYERKIAMRLIVFVKANADSEAGVMPSEQMLTEMGAFNEQLVDAGIIEAGEGLHPSSKGVRVNFSGTDRTVVKGPFPETEQLVAGFWIWKVDSLDQAIEWAKKCPNPMGAGGQLELRPFFGAADFGEALTPELRAKEADLRARATAN